MAGFTRFDNDLLEKILTSGLTKRQLKILLLVVRFSAGYQKEYAVLRRSDFAYAGVADSCIRAELEKLEGMRVILWDRARDLVRINADLQEWRVTEVDDERRRRFKIANKNGLKWQASVCRSAGLRLDETSTLRKERDRKTNKEEVFQYLVREYFTRVAPLSREEVMVMSGVPRRYGKRAIAEAIEEVAGSWRTGIRDFLKALDRASEESRSGKMSGLNASLGRYRRGPGSS
ncbi:MAG: replication protein [Chloroflexota bacterium]